MHELIHELPQERIQRVRGHELVTRRRRRREQPRDFALIRLHVSLQKRIQVQQVQPVQPDDAGYHLNEKHLRVELERAAGLQAVEQRLRERLRVVDELHRGESRFAVSAAVFFFVRPSYGRHLALQLGLFLLFRPRHALRVRPWWMRF